MYPIAAKKAEMLAKGKTQKEADEWETLASEIMQVIASKQLVPTMRTQCMRTAFQIPFDATVRVSLDTNLCMISERGYDLQDMTVWHRDKESVLQKNEITRFPHAVLEIKLEMTGGNMTPPKWVTDLQNSGMLYEVRMFVSLGAIFLNVTISAINTPNSSTAALFSCLKMSSTCLTGSTTCRCEIPS